VKRDDKKFILALFVTLVLGLLMVLHEHRLARATGQGEPVDLQQIRELVQEGRLSFHPAEFYRELGEEKR